jgi:hypothetical protein
MVMAGAYRAGFCCCLAVFGLWSLLIFGAGVDLSLIHGVFVLVIVLVLAMACLPIHTIIPMVSVGTFN